MATTVPGNVARNFSSHATDSASRWFVGSSRSKMSGCARRSRQMATRRRSPPERFFTRASPGGHRSASIARSTVLSISHAFVASSLVCSASMRDMSLSMSQSGSVMSIAIWLYSSTSAFTAATPTWMFSITVSPSSKGGSWGRYPTLMPSSRCMSPSNSLSTPARIFMSVDLPAPFAPKMPILAPRYMPRLMFLMSSLPVGVTLRTLERERMILRVSVW